MTIGSTLSNAASGLSSIAQQLAVVSQNVANAGSAGYARETVATSALTAGGAGFGVLTGPATRTVDQALQTALFQQYGDVAGQQTTKTALAAIDATQGTTAAGNDLASQLGALANAFTTLNAAPDNQAQQIATVDAAKTLAAGINALGNAYQTGRQTAQNAVVSDVAKLNTALQAIGTVSAQIVAAKSAGRSTADLESQRDAQEQVAAQLAGIRFLPQSTGAVLAVAGTGSLVNLASTTGPFAVAGATMGASAAGPALTLSGIDVTLQMTSGSIGANLQLRDTTLPLAQAGIDLFAKTLANRFDDQGLRLFTNPAGQPPSPTGSPSAAADVGFALVMQVNPAVTANPSSVRDGTTVSSGGQAVNPATGPAGYTALINRVTAGTFGTQAAPATAGLGAAGTLLLPYQPSSTLAGFAANMLATQSQASSDATDALATAQALQTTLQAKVQDSSGVSVDAELSNMITLQNAYGANAKVITAVQSMWTQLLNAVTP